MIHSAGLASVQGPPTQAAKAVALLLVLLQPLNAQQYLCSDGQCAMPQIGMDLSMIAFRMQAGPVAPASPLHITCPAGQYLQLVTGLCVPCSPGRAKPAMKGVCVPCGPGRFAAHPGTAVCSLCPAGTISTSHIATRCTPCPAGTFAPEQGSSECVPCFDNYFSLEGATSCRHCPQGTHRAYGTSKCVPRQSS